MELRKHHRERNTATSNELGTSLLKLWTKSRQELIDSLKLQIRPHSPATRIGTTDSRAKRVKLMPNSRTLCVELLYTGITLLESMFLTDHRKVERVTRGLIPLTKMIPHLRSSRKSHKLRGKLWQDTSSENSRGTSILITPLSISSLSITIGGESLREIRYLLIIGIDRSIIGSLGSNPVSLRDISSKNRWRRRHRRHWSKGARRIGDLATKNTPKPKSAHMDTHVSGKVCIVGTTKGQRAGRNRNIAR
jgi:hypothetical protein